MHQDTQVERIAGVDLGDKTSSVCVLDAVTGNVLEERSVRSRRRDFEKHFAGRGRMRVAIEVGAHSPWASRVLATCGHDVLVGNARQIRLVHASRRKNDRLDAEKLARLARLDPRLLSPIRHRGEQAQAHLAMLRSRATLVRSRTRLVNHVRSVLKAFGHRLPKGATATFHKRARERMASELAPALLPILDTIETLTRRISEVEAKVTTLARHEYPETRLLTQVPGVGTVSALTFVLTLEDPARFPKSRSVGAYVGLVAGQRQSGAFDPKQRITKEGDPELRRLLTQCAQHVLSSRSPDSDLKRHGLYLARSGTKEAKRRAVIAVARKLAVLLHALWRTGEVYEPLRNAHANGKRLPGAA